MNEPTGRSPGAREMADTIGSMLEIDLGARSPAGASIST
jgi:hypothetical protein